LLISSSYEVALAQGGRTIPTAVPSQLPEHCEGLAKYYEGVAKEYAAMARAHHGLAKKAK